MSKRMLIVATLAVWVTIFSGCTTTRTIVAPYPALPLPDRPSLPAVYENEFKAVQDENGISGYLLPAITVKNIFVRDKMRKKYELQLESIIKSTH